MKNTIQHIGLAALMATVATLAQAQTSTSGQSPSGTQTSPYVGECVPDVSGSGQSSTGQKAGKGKGSSGSAGTTSDTCPWHDAFDHAEQRSGQRVAGGVLARDGTWL